jgi:peptidoglycan/xylan/chitin deacetylase (PgdA/CDA1 family)
MRAVLTYHSIDDSGSPISVRRDAFERQVKWLASGRVRVTSLSELVGLPAAADAVAVTFDDAFENFGTYAAPLLADHGLPVTLFVVTERVGRTNDWNGRPVPGIPTLPLLGWPALDRLVTSGVSLGAHSRTHQDLTRLDGAALDDEIIGCAEQLARRLGVAPQAFAYPYGRVNDVAADCVTTAFAWGCTTDLRPLRDNEPSALLPRLDMYYFEAVSRLDAWGTPAFDRYLGIRRLSRRLRAMMTGAPPGGQQ